MLKLSDHLYIPPMGRVLEEAKAEKAEKNRQKRHFQAAKLNRLNSGWTTQPTSINFDLRSSLATLRARAREMCQNSSHFKKYLSLVRSNIVGPNGIQLQCRARLSNGSLDTRTNKRVEEAWWLWGMPDTCTITGKLSWVDLQNLVVTQIARDGEALIRHIYDPNNPFGYSLKVINIDYLDETWNTILPNGNRVLMSVEVDANDRPVAYWLMPPRNDLEVMIPAERRQRERIPAEEIIHAFLVGDDEAQVRGVTWFHAALLDAKNLAGYKEGVITSARMTANWVGFIEQEATDDVMFEGEDDTEGKPLPLQINNAPAQFNLLEPGMKVTQIDPKQPTQDHPEFYKSILTDLGAGLDIPYFQIAGDLSGVNFTSSRVGLIESRDVWKGLQAFVATHVCREVYHRFIRSAILTGQLTLTARQIIEVQNPMWRGRGWQYVQPREEVAASVDGLINNLTSLTQELAERGIDPVEHFETIKAERELAATYGIELEYVSSKTESESMTETDTGETGTETNMSNNRELTNGHSFDHLN